MKDYELMENLEIDFEDIYSEMAILLREEVVLEDADLDESKVLDILKKYVQRQLAEAGVTIFDETSSLIDMVRYISCNQKNEPKLYNLISYLLNVISFFQGWEALWYFNKKFERDDDTQLYISDHKLDSIETGLDCDVYNTFAALYYYYIEKYNLNDDVKALSL